MYLILNLGQQWLRNLEPWGPNLCKLEHHNNVSQRFSHFSITVDVIFDAQGLDTFDSEVFISTRFKDDSFQIKQEKLLF